MAIRIVALGVMAAVFLVTIPTVAATTNGHQIAGVGLVLVVLHQLVTAGGILRAPENWRWFWFAGLLLALGYAALIFHWNHQPGASPWAPGFLGFGWAAWGTATLESRTQIGAALGFFAGLTVLDASLVGLKHQPGHELLVSLWFVVPPVVIGLFGYALRLVSAGVAREMELRRAIQHATSNQRSTLHAQAEAARLLHDHVLHALHAVARIGGEVTPQMAQGECRQALAELARPRGLEHTATVGELLVTDPLVANLDPPLAGDTGPLPADVAQAMADAVRAALANVRAHARASRVSVTMAAEPRPQVEVWDDGVGFTPTRIPRQSLGLRESIHGRMDDVGGAARVESAPRQGTRVTLTWPREDSAPDPLWVSGAQSQVRRLLINTSWPGFGATLVGALMVVLTEGQWALALGALVPVVVGMVYTQILVHHRANHVDELLLLVVSLVSWWLLVWAAPPPTSGHTIHGLWFLWACSALLHLLVLQQPVRLAMVTVFGWVAAAAVGLAVLRSPITLLQAWPVILVPMGEGLATVAVQSRARLLEALQLEERRRTTESRQQAAARRRAWQLENFWSEHVTGEAMPLIRAIADGEPPTPERIRHAELLEATLRDELLLGPDQSTMLEVLNTLRRQGWHANTPSVSEDEVVFLESVAFWLAKIGSPARHRQEVKVTISRGMATLVVLDPSEQQRALWKSTADKLGAMLDCGPGYARMRAPLPERPSGRYVGIAEPMEG
ncbi:MULTISPECIES: sensor histidine kinase [unclassified Luteococcus]|uniref:sensor histidine kinase n=1 Tax=unclassified Luteococcus TaxID=2639923 RepID=UPI00313B7CA4